MKNRLVTGALIVALAACSPDSSQRPEAPLVHRETPGDTPAVEAVRFVDVAGDVGIDFIHTSGRSGRKYGVETIGSGAVFFDYNNDGWMDLYAVNGSDLPGYTSDVPPHNALFRNDGGAFFEVADSLGVGGLGYGMGAVAGDYDNDGDSDLFVGNFGRNVLYRNEGSEASWHFTDATHLIEGYDESWSTGTAFVDYDLDGDLDLYVANYLDYAFEEANLDAEGDLKRPRRHLAPTEYPGRRDFLYRNDDGRFVDVTEAVGLMSEACRELGPVFFDADLDGDPDLFQGNDATPNFLYRNDGGHFVEVGLFAGVAYNESGRPEGTMGVDVADYDLDGWPDIVMTNFQWESNTLYRNLGEGLFRDVSVDVQIGASSFDRLAFGINFFDYDSDGDADIYVANGHIDEDIERFDPQATYAQRDQLYRNEGNGRFSDISDAAGPGLALARVGRGSAVADYDNDGDLDVFVLNTAEPAVLLRNEGADRGHWLSIALRGAESNRDAYGTRVEVWSGARSWVREKRSASSYLSQSDPRLHFGLGEKTRVDSVVIYWPSGKKQVERPAEIDRFVSFTESNSATELVVRSADSAEASLDGNADEAMRRFWEQAALTLPEKVRVPVAPPPALEPLLAAHRERPDDLDALLDLSNALLARRAYGQAKEYLLQALEMEPQDARIHWAMGRMLSDLGDLPGAVESLARAAELDDALAAPNYLLANILVRQQYLEEAVVRYERALARDPRYLQAYFNLAGLHARQTDYGLALAVIKRGLENLPDEIELLFQMGRVFFVQARYDEARKTLDRVLSLQPERAEARELLAQIHLNNRDGEQALAVLRQGLEQGPDSALLQARLGALLLQEGRVDEAAVHLQNALRADPDRDEVYYNLGQALLRAGKEAEGRQLLDYFSLLQREHQNILDFKTAIVLNPNDADAFYRLGVIYARIGRYRAGLQAYTAALEIAPDHIDALNNLGNIHLRQRRLMDAINAYEKVLARAPQYARAHHNLGNAYVLLNDAPRAVAAFERAVGADSSYAAPRQMLAQLYRRAGRLQEADAQQAAYEYLSDSGARP